MCQRYCDLRVWVILWAIAILMSHFTVSTLWLWVLGDSSGPSTLRRPWDLQIRKFSPCKIHVYIKLSIRRLLLTTGSTHLITFFTVWAASVNFAANVGGGSQKTKNRDLKMSMGFGKHLLLFLFSLSASITFCSQFRACSMPPRQPATFTGIFFLLYPETDPSTDHTLCWLNA